MISLTRRGISVELLLFFLTIICLVMAGGNVHVSATEDPNLVVFFDMQQTGNTLTDLSGNGNTGSIANTVPSVQGPYDLVRQIAPNTTASCGKIRIAAAPSINNQPLKTYSMWLYVNSNAGAFFSRGLNCWLSQDSNGLRYRIPFRETNGTETTDLWKAGSTLPLGSYVHLVIVHDTSASRIAPKFYINGVEASATWDTTQSNKTSTTGLLPSDDSAASMYLGAKMNSSTSSFPDRSMDGMLGRFKFYNRLLSAAEVAQLYDDEKWFYNSDNTVRSDMYQIDNTMYNISGVPSATTAEALAAGIKKKSNTTITVYKADDSVRTGLLQASDKLGVNSSDGDVRLYTYSITLDASNQCLEIVNKAIVDNDNSPISTIQGKTNITAKFDVINNTNSSKSAQAFLVLYRTNMLIGLAYSPVTPVGFTPEDNTATIQVGFNLADYTNDLSNCNVKAFLFENLDNMRPLTESIHKQ